ncbi:VPLPA-CTERM sorting domain-containing protein [Cognatiyoonia sp.]
MIYVATNRDPSILNVGLEPVPLPAGLPLLLAGLGGFALVRRRQT